MDMKETVSEQSLMCSEPSSPLVREETTPIIIRNSTFWSPERETTS